MTGGWLATLSVSAPFWPDPACTLLSGPVHSVDGACFAAGTWVMWTDAPSRTIQAAVIPEEGGRGGRGGLAGSEVRAAISTMLRWLSCEGDIWKGDMAVLARDGRRARSRRASERLPRLELTWRQHGASMERHWDRWAWQWRRLR